MPEELLSTLFEHSVPRHVPSLQETGTRDLCEIENF